MHVDIRRRIKVFGIASLLLLVAAHAAAHRSIDGAPAASAASQAMSARYEDVKWQTMAPDLGNDSPQISILRVDSKNSATQLLIRTPKKMHVPMHWHSANETHTMILGTIVFEHEGARQQLGPGGFNYMPARMQHQAWTSEGAVVFITVDGPWDINWVSNPPTQADLGKTPPANQK